jgi:AbrB family looped-hinge helix DNA binding protein
MYYLEWKYFFMKVTVKGQVTIPVSLRERFGLNPGTEVEFVAADGVLQLRRRKSRETSTSRSELWLAKAAGSAKTDLTTDQLMAITRGED